MIQQQLLFRRLHAISKSSYTTQSILYRPPNSVFATSARSHRNIQRLECFASSHNRQFKQRCVAGSNLLHIAMGYLRSRCLADKAILRKGRIGQEARGGSDVLPALQFTPPQHILQSLGNFGRVLHLVSSQCGPHQRNRNQPHIIRAQSAISHPCYAWIHLVLIVLK